MDESVSFFSQVRSELSKSPWLHAAFDSFWSSPSTWFTSNPVVRRRLYPWLDKLGRDVTINPWGSGLGELSVVPSLARRGRIAGADVLLIGVEHGHEIDSLWVRHAPRSITGIDIGDYTKDWAQLVDIARPVRLSFARMDCSSLGFDSSTFDLVYCQGVLPHVLRFGEFIDEVHRVLRPTGLFAAISCPPWRAYEGPHMPGFDFQHLLLPEDDFRAMSLTRSDGWAHWYKMGLFNRLTVIEMLSLIERRFDLTKLAVAPSRGAIQYRRRHRDNWEYLTKRYEELDLMIRLFLVEATPRSDGPACNGDSTHSPGSVSFT
jgi:SAM-dependent methyltransferase